ncbi:MAG: response regulator [Bacillota bacterium]|uniref:Stage 0 sporulation protein A homolog n=1 Tax=Thermanaerosceptrum fracticalcis TaxID=1712410 RepID=A0A7G6E2G4_THEFR|nr:response regulator transcription factor [Thermanaerosceptrum fracticalcis]QNB46268.1 response regulator [Thermanaerosceptrum fracticalcis]
MEYHVLVVDDEPKILSMIENFLKNEGFTVTTAQEGNEALRLFGQAQPHAVILDLMLPGMNGLDVCKEIRKNSTVPIIMLTAKTEEIDKLLGLELGADDYITKPFSLKELSARLRAVLRRTTQYSEKQEEQVMIRGDLQIDPVKREVKVKGELIPLTPTEYNILYILARHPGRPYSRLQLLNMALDESYLGYERVIDTHVSNLRKKIEPNPAEPYYIQTVYGIGYKFGEKV